VRSDEAAKAQERARLFIKVMNYIGTTASVPGPLDFGQGVARFRELMPEMQYPILAGNIIDDATGKPLFKSSIVVESAGYRIGLLGIASRKFDYRQEALPHEGITILDPGLYAKDAVPELKKQCDFVVALVNVTTDELRDVAKNGEGISFILAGHIIKSFFQDYDEVEGIPVFQVPPRGREVGVLTIVPSGKDFRFKNRSEIPVIEDRLKQYREVMERMEKQAGGKKVEEYYTDSPAALSRYQKMKEKYAEEEKKLDNLKSAGSYYELKVTSLGKNVEDDMQVNGWVTKYADAYDPTPPSEH
jgi:2',3'-cyclic-nucleotide 2'-phosphodiesterase (5'-nucleotidase family)